MKTARERKWKTGVLLSKGDGGSLVYKVIYQLPGTELKTTWNEIPDTFSSLALAEDHAAMLRK